MNSGALQKILIVDDNEMNRMILSDMLDEEFILLEASSGEEAIAILEKQSTQISLVLLDVVMPGMDGFQVLMEMNRRHWIDDIQVIMISAESAPSFMRRAYDLGAVDFISRPFDQTIVHKRIRNTMLLFAKQKQLEERLAWQIEEKERNSSMMVSILSHIVEFRNGESGAHVLNINRITELLMNALFLRTPAYNDLKEDLSVIRMASSLHDIGKIDIPSEILNKPARLTKEEFEIIKTHTVIGAEMMRRLPLYQDEPLIHYSYQICRWHHERYDGNGYPDGLAGDEIPIAAQVVSIADVYDALTSKRCYKDAYSHRKAMDMIFGNECGVFNPLLLDCLTDIEDHLQLRVDVHSSMMQSRAEAKQAIRRL